MIFFFCFNEQRTYRTANPSYKTDFFRMSCQCHTVERLTKGSQPLEYQILKIHKPKPKMTKEEKNRRETEIEKTTYKQLFFRSEEISVYKHIYFSLALLLKNTKVCSRLQTSILTQKYFSKWGFLPRWELHSLLAKRSPYVPFFSEKIKC